MKKRGFKYYLHIYLQILKQDLKSKMSYRADFIISIMGMICTNMLGFVSFWIIFNEFPSIKGWSYYEMLFLYGFSLVSLTPVQCFFDNNWNLQNYVFTGDFIKYCFRPVNLFFYYMSENFDVKGLGQLAFGIGTLVYAWGKLGLTVNIIMIVKTIVYLIAASLFMIAIQNFAAATCFWVINSGYVLEIVFRIREYAKYPITIFNSLFRFLFTFIIPIAFIAYYPSLVILRSNKIPIISWLSPIIGCLFFYLAYKFWMCGAKHYGGTGS